MNRLKKVIVSIYPRLTVATFILQLFSLAALFTFVFVRKFVYPYEGVGDYSADPALIYGLVAGLFFLVSVPLSFLQLITYFSGRLLSVEIKHTVLYMLTSILSGLFLIGYFFS